MASKASAGFAALMAACCLLGPAAVIAAVGATAGSTLGIVAGVVLALACVAAVLVWRRRGRERTC
jgi:Flp pilus assembly protein TadB